MDPLYIGIDIGKFAHVASLVSTPLLTRYKRFDRCPLVTFPQSRDGFEHLVTELARFTSQDCWYILMESTGHYGYALLQFLEERGVTVYLVHPQTKRRIQKSDRRDAQSLAVLLYNQLEKHVLVDEPSQRARLVIPPSDAVQRLRALVQHHSELVRDTTRRKNQLTAICDELTPEISHLFTDVNCQTALALRETFTTPEAIAEATIEELLTIRKHGRPGRNALLTLQDEARSSIGTRNEARRKSLLLEQKHLMAELRLLQEHVDELETEIGMIIAESREGQILTSCPSIGSVNAAVILAGIGNIANFEKVTHLRAYCGWSPHQVQTGKTKDSMTLTKGGRTLLKRTWYLVAYSAIRHDSAWLTLYNRLVPIQCRYDERTKKYVGKRKVMGRVIGQMIRVVYHLLRQDYDTLAALPVGAEIPPPVLYERSKHHISSHATQPVETVAKDV